MTFTTHSLENTPGSEIWHKLAEGSLKGSPKVCDSSQHNWEQVTVWHYILQLGQVKNVVKLGSFDQDALGEFQFSLGISLVPNKLEQRAAKGSALTCMAKGSAEHRGQGLAAELATTSTETAMGTPAL